MQKLKNKTTGEEFVITGSIGVPREVEENVFEVWTHFSIDLDGDGQIDTVEVHPESTEWEVIEVADVVPVPEPTPEPAPEPTPIVLTQEEIDRNAWLQQWQVYDKANRAMKALAEAGFEPTAEETTRFNALKTWVGTNRKPEYSQYI